METRLKVERPDDVVFELTLKGTMSDFNLLRRDLDQAKQAIVSWQLVRALEDLINQSRKVFRSEQPDELDPRVADFHDDLKNTGGPMVRVPAFVVVADAVPEGRGAPVAEQGPDAPPRWPAQERLVTLNEMIFDEHGPAAPDALHHQGRPVTSEDRLRWANEMRDAM